jgi:FkbM family methyltransferase
MLIDLKSLIKEFNLNIKGIIHIGAHEAEEYETYIANGIISENQLWIEALAEKVDFINKNFPNLNVINAVLTNQVNEDVIFNVTNNYQSSSILNLKHHLVAHPSIFIKNKIILKTNTLKNIFEQQNLDILKYNFINIDIQGAELIALDGAGDLINNIDYIYAEVNEKELYEGCAIIEIFDLFLKQKCFKRVKTEMTPYGWGDALYIRETLL